MVLLLFVHVSFTNMHATCTTVDNNTSHHYFFVDDGAGGRSPLIVLLLSTFFLSKPFDIEKKIHH